MKTLFWISESAMIHPNLLFQKNVFNIIKDFDKVYTNNLRLWIAIKEFWDNLYILRNAEREKIKQIESELYEAKKIWDSKKINELKSTRNEIIKRFWQITDILQYWTIVKEDMWF